ncbi:MAG: PPC domain-containing protein [Planctomycetia bacterium]|nr:PPC domain-containing protein [Planctomycetia bacterium]
MPESQRLRLKRYATIAGRALWALAAVLATARMAVAQAPSITHTVPAAVAAGAATDIVLYGANLAAPTGAWWGMPAEAALTPGVDKNGTEPAQVSYRVNVPATAAVGIYGLRVANGGGISNLRLLMVDDLPSAVDNGSNKSPEAAQQITLPVAVDGACEAESYDFYRFEAVAGQRITVEVVARRLGYPLDAVIRLLDSSGHELAYSDDEPGIGADCRFAHTIAVNGTYLLELRDIRYLGGPTHRYRMRVGNFPLATTTYPMGGRRGSQAKVRLAGAEGAEMAPMVVPMPASSAVDRMTVAAKFPGGQGSGIVNVAVGSASEQVELEPNDTPETASPVTLPTAINGRFDAAKDRDWFQFEAKQGQRWVFTGKTRSLGSPSDLFMRLSKADGGQVAEAEDSGTEDGIIDFTAPADGVYRLMVEDLLRRGGPDFVYRITVEVYRPGFTLAVEGEKFDAPTRGVFVAKVTCARRDYDGPIALSVEGAGEGLSLAGNTIAEKGKETVLRVTLPANMEPGRWANVRILGRAKIGDAEFQTTASTLTPLKTALGGWAYPPADLDGLVGLGVGPVFPDFFQLSAAPAGAIPFPQFVGTTSFKVEAKRLNKFDDKIELAVAGLPEGVSAKVAPIEKGKPEVAIEVAGPMALAEGDYPLSITGTATFQNQPKTVTIADLVLRVVKPVQVSLAPAGPLVAGGKQAVAVKLTRYGDATGPVTVRLKHVPTGMSGPPEVTVPEGQNEAAIELSAAGDMAAGKVEIAATATMKVKDRAVSLESDPVSLEITRP